MARIFAVALILLKTALFGFHSVELQNGGFIQAEVISERSSQIFLDLGYDIISIPKEAVVSVLPFDADSGEALAQDLKGESLFRVDSNSEPRSIRDWVDYLGEAVVLIQTPTGLGSGFLIEESGYLITNDHVIAGEHKISVTLFQSGGRELVKRTYDKVRIVATSAEIDLALLKIETDEPQIFETVPVAPEGSSVREGQTVFAIGSPLGLDRSVSEGIVSVANRVLNGRVYLQTTTQINPGNSGGPLFNLNGEVVGVNNRKIAAVGFEGLGFSIAADTLRAFINNRDAFAFDPRNPNAGFRYLAPPSKEAGAETEAR